MNFETIKEMKLMRECGETYAEIGKKFGVSRQRAHQLVSKEILISDSLKEKCQKTIASLRIVRKYQASPVKVVIDDTTALILSLMNEIESLETKVERLEKENEDLRFEMSFMQNPYE